MIEAPKFNFSKQGEMDRFKQLPEEIQNQVIEAAHEEALGMILAKALQLEYESGGPEFLTGVQSHRIGRKFGKRTVDGKVVTAGGNGSYTVMVPSQFKLWVELPGSGKKVDVWAASDFRESMGTKRLTKNIRDAIAAAKPAHVALVENESARGTKYFRVDPDQLSEWAENAKRALEKGNKGAREKAGEEVIQSKRFNNEIMEMAVNQVVREAAKKLTAELPNDDTH
jgi:hypothetical protein